MVDIEKEKALKIARLVRRHMSVLRHDVGRDAAEYDREMIEEAVTRYVENLWNDKQETKQ